MPPAGSNGGSEEGNFTVVVQYHAPCVLPWIWDAARPAGSGTLQTQPIPLRAGAEGALGLRVSAGAQGEGASGGGKPCSATRAYLDRVRARRFLDHIAGLLLSQMETAVP